MAARGRCPLLAGLLCCLLALAAQHPVRAQEYGGNASDVFGDGAGAAVPADQGGFGDLEAFFGGSPSPTPGEAFGSVGKNVTRLKYTGTGTTSYQPDALAAPTGAVSYACSLGFLSPAFLGAYVGVSSSFYNKGYGCGQCIKLQCDDSACAQIGRQLVAQVVDLCGDCFDADMSIAQPLFKNLTGSNGPSAQISWDWAPCGDLVQGNIKMLQKPGGTAYYQAFSFSNTKQPIVAVRMNNQLLKRSQSGNWWEWNPGQAINPRGPFKLDLLGANRQVLTVSLPALRSLDIGIQFRAT